MPFDLLWFLRDRKTGRVIAQSSDRNAIDAAERLLGCKNVSITATTQIR